jgi:hypothetical protein
MLELTWVFLGELVRSTIGVDQKYYSGGVLSSKVIFGRVGDDM